MAYLPSQNPTNDDNIYSCEVLALAAGGTSTVTFPKAVNVIEIEADTDAPITFKFNGAAPAAAGTAAAPVLGGEGLVGPSYDKIVAQPRNGMNTLGIKNIDASVAIARLIVRGWATVGYGA